MRTTDGTLHFLVNGIDQGPAANGIAAKVYAVIDMYGKCAQVTIIDNTPGTNQENGNVYIPSEAQYSLSVSLIVYLDVTFIVFNVTSQEF